MFEHAADSNLLIKHLLMLNSSAAIDNNLDDPLFTISFDSDDTNSALILKKEYVELTMLANGKAELYFHAYFWTTYMSNLFDVNPDLKNCLEVKRMQTLANKPKQVMELISRN